MFGAIRQVLTTHNIFLHTNQGITIAKVQDADAGFYLTKEILVSIVDKKTVLYLSGGSLKTLYEALAHEGEIIPGAVGLVDERYGEKFHANSNEAMIGETQFLRYLSARDIPFYPILRHCEERSNPHQVQNGGDRHAFQARDDECRKETAENYDAKFRELNNLYPKSVGLLGIGPDGHTSSIIPNRPDFHNPWFDADHQHLMVSEFDDPKSHYKERVGMTFLALSMLDVLIVPAFGSAKQNTFDLLFRDGSEEEIPARFFKRPDIAKKTLFISDQMF